MRVIFTWSDDSLLGLGTRLRAKYSMARFIVLSTALTLLRTKVVKSLHLFFRISLENKQVKNKQVFRIH